MQARPDSQRRHAPPPRLHFWPDSLPRPAREPSGGVVSSVPVVKGPRRRGGPAPLLRAGLALRPVFGPRLRRRGVPALRLRVSPAPRLHAEPAPRAVFGLRVRVLPVPRLSSDALP